MVFEALKVAGGMMKVGIPDFRLPKDKLQAEIAVIEKAGVEIRLNSPVANIDELTKKGYAAVFIGSGAHQAQKLNVEGIDLKGVMSGIDFLREVNLGHKVSIGNDVVVVGGGSTAMDAARLARRLGAGNVRLVYRRTRTEMPAQLEELVGAEEEGVEMDFLVNPLQVVGKAGKVSGIHCIKTELADFDDSGRRRPLPVDGSEYTIRASFIIYCLGQKLSLGLTGGTLNLDRRGHIAVDPRTMATSVPGVFAGGDAVNPSTVIESVAQGRQAAVSIDRYFGREGRLYDQAAPGGRGPLRRRGLPQDHRPQGAPSRGAGEARRRAGPGSQPRPDPERSPGRGAALPALRPQPGAGKGKDRRRSGGHRGHAVRNP